MITGTAFSEKFRSRFGYEPILTASNAYDALNAVLTALSSGADAGVQIRNFLVSQEFNTVTFGKFRFAQDGSVPSQVKVVEHSGATLLAPRAGAKQD